MACRKFIDFSWPFIIKYITIKTKRCILKCVSPFTKGKMYFSWIVAKYQWICLLPNMCSSISHTECFKRTFKKPNPVAWNEICLIGHCDVMKGEIWTVHKILGSLIKRHTSKFCGPVPLNWFPLSSVHQSGSLSAKNSKASIPFSQD